MDAVKSVVSDCLKTTAYAVEFHIHTIAGGTPLDPELLESHLRRKGLGEDAIKKVIEDKAAAGEEEEGIEKATAKCWNTFLSDATGFYLVPCAIKQMLKEAAVAMKTNTSEGNVGIKHQFQVSVWIDENKLYLHDADGNPILKAPWTEKALTVSGPQGKRSILQRFDYLEDVTISFTLRTADFKGQKVSEKTIKELLALAENGVKLGAKRPADWGRFTVTKFEAK